MNTDYEKCWLDLDAAVARWSEEREIYPRDLLALMESIQRTEEGKREPDTSRFLSWIVE